MRASEAFRKLVEQVKTSLELSPDAELQKAVDCAEEFIKDMEEVEADAEQAAS